MIYSVPTECVPLHIGVAILSKAPITALKIGAVGITCCILRSVSFGGRYLRLWNGIAFRKGL